MARRITDPGYDPFASPYDAPERDIIGSFLGDAFEVIVAPVKATAKVATGDFAGAYHTVKNSLTTSAGVVAGKLGTTALGAAALVFPPAAPAIAGVYGAAMLLKQLDSPDSVKRAAAATTVAATQSAMKAGMPGTDRGWAAITTAQGLLRGGVTPAELKQSVGVAPKSSAASPTVFSSSYRGVVARPVYRGMLIDEQGRVHGPATWEMRS